MGRKGTATPAAYSPPIHISSLASASYYVPGVRILPEQDSKGLNNK